MYGISKTVKSYTKDRSIIHKIMNLGNQRSISTKANMLFSEVTQLKQLSDMPGPRIYPIIKCLPSIIASGRSK